MMARVIGDEKTRFGGGKLDEIFRRVGSEKPDQIIDLLVALLLAVPLPHLPADGLVEICDKNADRAAALAKRIQRLAALPEFQLG